MNRRRFLELLGTAALGSGIVYSFPSVIVPKNIQRIECLPPISFPVLEAAYKRLIETGNEPRFIILKARAVGYSTYLEVTRQHADLLKFISN